MDETTVNVPDQKRSKRLAHTLSVFLLVTLLINTCIAVTITGFQMKNEYVALMRSRVEAVGDNLKTLMEDILDLGLPIGSLTGIEKELKHIVTGDLGALYANVTDDSGAVIYSYPPLPKKTVFHATKIVSLMKHNERDTFVTNSSYNTFIPIMNLASNKVVGGINIGILKKKVYLQTFDTLVIIVITFFSFIAATLILLHFLTQKKLKPLEMLNDGAIALANGDLSTRAPVNETNEIGSLANSFNYMAEQLQEDRVKLTTYTSELEQKNAKLQDAHEKITQREKKLKDAQSQLILSEKMASLGLLIAGIAHEINTPAGAIANVASDLRKKLKQITDSFENINQLNQQDLVLFQALLEEFQNNNLSTQTGLNWRKNREVRQWLSQHGVEDNRDVANILQKHNLFETTKLHPYLRLFKTPWVVTLADSVETINSGMQICESSINKITDIVKALKYYAYTDMDKTSLVNINENIDNVLLLLHNKLKYSINVTKTYSDLPRIHCTSEISQVWTNLITNAHDAIVELYGEGKDGHLDISTSYRDNTIVVEIKDNGSGIPREKIQKIFDPFFTTKGIGKGTGLGLSIVSGIVKKHKGTISATRDGKQTIFSVALPVTNENRIPHHGQQDISSAVC